MRTTCIALALVVLAVSPLLADGQFRIAGSASTPVAALPDGGIEEWAAVIAPGEQTLTGWQWEVVFNRLGLGMHYTMRFVEPLVISESANSWYLDWKGDFFLSYHILGGGSLVDPFVEFGWGNVGTTLISSPDYARYPDWEEEVSDGDALALSFYQYFGAGVAVDLNGLLLGAKLSYIPSELSQPAPDSTLRAYDLQPFEVSFFGGVALGGHRNRHDRSRHDWDDWD
jgi:hypothetical protein